MFTKRRDIRILENARKLITNKDNWTTYYLARDKDGREVSPESSKAVKWCASGAFSRYCIYLSWQHDRLKKLLDQTSYDLYKCKYLSNVNDIIGHEAALNVYDTTIERIQNG